MKETKILLTIYLEGVLSQKTEVVVLPFVNHNYRDTKVISKEDFIYKKRIPSKCVKKICINNTTYRNFISNEIPEWYKPNNNKGKSWFDLSKTAKVSQHCARIAENNNFDFIILDN